MIAHLDLDAFFAAVETHRRPEFRGRAVIVDGDPQGGGAVATADYAARRFGIRSAMGASEAAHAVRTAVAERVRLSCSLGVATCTVVAKAASERDKPGARGARRRAAVLGVGVSGLRPERLLTLF